MRNNRRQSRVSTGAQKKVHGYQHRCSEKFVAPKNYSHTQQYGLGLRLRIGLNLGLRLRLEEGLRLELGLGLGLRLGLGLGLALVTL